jgi:hypothetical protein
MDLQKKRLKKLAGISTLVFPLLLLIGFVMHPDLFSFRIVTTAEQLANNFRHQTIFHIGHLIVAIAIPFILIHVFYVMTICHSKSAFYGGIVAIIGAAVLALDKGSLCLVLSGFDTLNDVQFQSFMPFLQVLVDKRGLLIINWLIVLLPLGTMIQAHGLRKEGYFTKRQATAVIIGLLLLNNPDIELFSTLGVLLMMIGYIPLGLKLLNENESAKVAMPEKLPIV